MPSDPDKEAVYYAENLTFEETIFSEPLHTSEFTALAERLFAHEWWVSNSIPVPVILPTNGRNTSSFARTYHSQWATDEKQAELHIAPQQIDVHTLAHEAAHIAQYHLFPSYRNPRMQSHGPEFRRTYVTVVEIMMGYDAAERLMLNFTHYLKDRWFEVDFIEVGIYEEWKTSQALTMLGQIIATNRLANGPTRINGAIAL